MSSELFAAIEAGDDARVRSLLAADASLAMARDPAGVSAVMLALYRGQRDVADRLVEVLPELDLFEATALGRADRVRELLTADPSLGRAWSADGFTALHFAAFFGSADAARALLAAGADPNVRSRNEMSVMPIHSAVAGRHGDMLAALVAAGAEVNVAQRDGWTPLHGAAQHGDVATVDLLLEAGADAAARNDDGITAADLADRAGHSALATRLGELERTGTA
jgi:ankyrin repeat protein